MKILAVQDMELTEAIANGLAQLPALEIFSYWRGRWSRAAARPFRNHDRLKELLLYEVQGSEEALAGLAGGNLQELELNGIPLTESLLQSVGRCEHLRSLSLTRAPELAGAGMRYLEQLDQLRSVELNVVPLEDHDLEFVRSLPHLERAYIHGKERQITDAGLAHLGDCPTLRDVTLYHTRATARGLLALRRVERLEHLRVDSMLLSPEVTAALQQRFARLRINTPTQTDLRIWNLESGEHLWSGVAGNPVYLNEQQIGLLASAELSRFDMKTGGWLGGYPLPTDDVLAAASSDGSALAFWKRTDDSLYVVRPINGEVPFELPAPNGSAYSSVVLSSDGKRLALGIPGGIQDSLVEVWDVASKTRLAILNQPGFYDVRPLQISPNGRLLVVWGFASPRGEVSARVWRLPVPPVRVNITHPESVATLGGFGSPGGAAFSADNRRLAVGSTDAIRVFDLSSGQKLRTIPDGDLLRQTQHAEESGDEQSGWSVLGFAPNGRLAALGLYRPEQPVTISIIDLETGEQLREFTGSQGGGAFDAATILSVRFSLTSRLFATSFFRQPQTGSCTQSRTRPGSD